MHGRDTPSVTGPEGGSSKAAHLRVRFGTDSKTPSNYQGDYLQIPSGNDNTINCSEVKRGRKENIWKFNSAAKFCRSRT